MTLAIPTTTTATYRVVRADPERDRDAILSVWARNLPVPPSSSLHAKFDWYYCQNPIGPGRCWLLLAGPGEHVVGTTGLGLRRLRTPQSTFLAALASDLAVDQEHRLLRPALMLQRALIESVSDDLPIIYALPGQQSAAVLDRVGYQTVGHFHRYAKLLRVDRYLHRLAAIHPTIPQTLAALANPLVRFSSAENWRRSRGYLFTQITDFDQRFDELFARVSSSHSIVAERNSRFLRWRYATCPLLTYQTFGLFNSARDRLLAYAVCHFPPNHQATIIDLLADDTAGAIEELLANVISVARAKDAASLSLSILHPRPLEHALNALGFTPRRPGGPLMVYPVQPIHHNISPQHFHNGYLTEGDEDYN